MTIYDIVKKLIGNIMPIGETREDDIRFEHLKATTELVDLLLDDIKRASHCSNKGEFSLKRSEEFASKFLDNLTTNERG